MEARELALLGALAAGPRLGGRGEGTGATLLAVGESRGGGELGCRCRRWHG
jgi:hypothetical protein